MALDIAILGEDGRPEVGVQIRVAPHVRLMVLVEEARLPLLHRLKDFYEDADFAAGELGTLLEEVGIALERSHGDSELVEFLLALQGLATTAIRKGTGLAVIAD